MKDRAGHRSDSDRSSSSPDDKSGSDHRSGSRSTTESETRSGGSSRETSSSKTKVNISSEQRTTIRQTIVSSGGGAKVSRSSLGGVSVSVGVSVPRTVTIHRLPPKIVEIVPEYAEYSYFITDDDVIVIVDPDTYEIVYVIES